jgi:hypothetical protein
MSGAQYARLAPSTFMHLVLRGDLFIGLLLLLLLLLLLQLFIYRSRA